jgi:hypothetical protein
VLAVHIDYTTCHNPPPNRKPLTRLPIRPTLRRRRNQMRQRRLHRVVAPQQININDTLEPIGADVVDALQEVAGRARNHKVDGAQLGHAPRRRRLQLVHLPHVDAAETQHARPWPCCRDVGGHGLGFGDVAPQDAGVGAEVYKSAHLGAADGAGAAGAEDDFVVWEGERSAIGNWSGMNWRLKRGCVSAKVV